jgi:hypothetical protein
MKFARGGMDGLLWARGRLTAGHDVQAFADFVKPIAPKANGVRPLPIGRMR